MDRSFLNPGFVLAAPNQSSIGSRSITKIENTSILSRIAN
ncbi:hypothetical protein LEP1GSC047_1250 [Leptospira inadai serovar Lyme str. 10]|uniref:Uncharacterized protein n=1 Tax=Leptospira inadai serovar Lyme str. 10 TaxID=1049790 RepID=V6HH30_9LEPT|nr:hypothetical protein LEP1GSC047_1250 [Leptospira inadai serovar Lyme str. 10]